MDGYGTEQIAAALSQDYILTPVFYWQHKGIKRPGKKTGRPEDKWNGKRLTNEGERNMFSGLLVCADCGRNLHYHFNQGDPDIKYFNCSNYKGNRGTCSSTHYIRVDFLKQVMLGEIRCLARFADKYENEFVKAVAGHSQQAAVSGLQSRQRELNALLTRERSLMDCLNGYMRTTSPGKYLTNAFAG